MANSFNKGAANVRKPYDQHTSGGGKSVKRLGVKGLNESKPSNLGHGSNVGRARGTQDGDGRPRGKESGQWLHEGSRR